MGERVQVPALDAILGQQFPVGKHGFVRPVDYMGGDASVVQAARVSYGDGTKQVHEDEGLIRYLMRHHHTTPFEMCEIKFHVRVPMDTWRQWIRHRTASVNEYSTRYSVAIDAMETTDPDAWRLQATDNKQGSDGTLPIAPGDRLSRREKAFQAIARRVYNERIEAGVAREQARKDLPLSTYTEAYWKVDLHNLMHFLRLRMDPHAQAEIRDYACTMGDIVAAWVPMTWRAFLDYQWDTMTLTDDEAQIIKTLLRADVMTATTFARDAHLLRSAGGKDVLTREGREFVEKIRRLGFGRTPWDAGDADPLIKTVLTE